MTRSDLLRVLDLSGSAFDKSIAPIAPPELRRREGKRVLWFGRGVIEWYFAAGPDGVPDAAVSEHRIRLLRVQAARQELRLSQERRDVLPRADVEAIDNVVIDAIRALMEKLAERFGEPARALAAGVLESVAQAYDKHTAPVAPDEPQPESGDQNAKK